MLSNISKSKITFVLPYSSFRPRHDHDHLSLNWLRSPELSKWHTTHNILTVNLQESVRLSFGAWVCCWFAEIMDILLWLTQAGAISALTKKHPTTITVSTYLVFSNTILMLINFIVKLYSMPSFSQYFQVNGFTHVCQCRVFLKK